MLTGDPYQGLYSFLMKRNRGLRVFHSRRHAAFVENQFAANPPGNSSGRGIFASRLPLSRIMSPDRSDDSEKSFEQRAGFVSMTNSQMLSPADNGQTLL
jgi:hypothetical protein